MNNPMNIFQLLNSNPQQIINKMLGNNPMAKNLLSMMKNNDAKGIEEMARNLAKEKGQDADKLYDEIKSKFGM